MILEQFEIYDVDRSGYLEVEEATPFIRIILSRYSEQYKNMDAENQAAAILRLFDWMDVDKSGKVTLREFKSSLLRAWQCHLPPGLLDQLENEAAAE